MYLDVLIRTTTSKVAWMFADTQDRVEGKSDREEMDEPT